MQDLEDIRNGIQIIHASDAEKRNKENKKERRQQLRKSSVRRLEKKLLEREYESLKECSADRRHADKWLGEERIVELQSYFSFQHFSFDHLYHFGCEIP